ncbi:hypothetical protein [Paenibacillus planticolens]|nr:hypothetical protein [Paenibacillus planticolens]
MHNGEGNELEMQDDAVQRTESDFELDYDLIRAYANQLNGQLEASDE